jgi:hypothetical protein
VLRILLVVLGLAVVVYIVTRAVQGRRRQPSGPSPTPGRSDPWAEQAYQRAVRARAEEQRNGTAPAPPPAPEIVIDEDVFGFDEPSAEYFIVTSPASSRAVVEAVRRANHRFMLVDEEGTEHADHSALEASFDAHPGEDDLYTPNYTAEPRVTPVGVEGYVDCKGGIEYAMGVTMRRVLHEELARLGAPARVRVRTD